MKKVLFVCTANICRSPMAQEIFNALAEEAGLPFRAESAGTSALEGAPMAEKSVAVLEEAGIYPEPHHARQVSEAMVGEVELVLAMTPQHADTLRRLCGNPREASISCQSTQPALRVKGSRTPTGSLRAHHGRIPEHFAPALRIRRLRRGPSQRIGAPVSLRARAQLAPSPPARGR